MAKSNDRERRRATFDHAATRYQRARPGYPDELFDQLIALTALRPGDRLLEVGCATGKATAPLARRGFAVTCVEIGAELGAAARENLRGLPIHVEVAAFEEWPAAPPRFDLVFAATAWRWIDPACRYQRAHDVLVPGGHLAFWDALHVVPHDGDPFFGEIQDVYEEIGVGRPLETLLRRPGHVQDMVYEVQESGLFEVVHLQQFDWETLYDAEGYIDLLQTFSDHIEMQQWQRDRLFGEIRRRLQLRPDGLLRRHWGAALHIARALPLQG